MKRQLISPKFELVRMHIDKEAEGNRAETASYRSLFEARTYTSPESHFQTCHKLQSCYLDVSKRIAVFLRIPIFTATQVNHRHLVVDS